MKKSPFRDSYNPPAIEWEMVRHNEHNEMAYNPIPITYVSILHYRNGLIKQHINKYTGNCDYYAYYCED